MNVLQTIDYHAVAPELIVAGTALAVLVADLFWTPARRRLALPLCLSGVLAALALTLSLLGDERATFCTPPTRLPAVLGGTGLAVGQSCSFVVDGYALLFQVLFLSAAAVVLLLSLGHVEETGLPVGEYHFLLLSSLVGMLVMAASRDLIMLVVALEVVSLPGFALAGLRRRDPRSTEAALKFFLVSVLSTAVMLFGMSLLYGVTGTVQLDRLAVALGRPAIALPVTGVGVVLVLVGFGFKVSAVPFHFWTPDTYQGAPLPIAAFLAVASKAAGFAGLITVVIVGLRPYADVWGPVLAALAVATMTLGNLVALQQRHVVRLLAWSSIAQAGYLLVPLGVAASAHGRGDDALATAVAATLAYLVIYAAMTLGAFACVVAVARRSPGNLIADYRGLGRTCPLLAAALAFFLLCLAGLPPGLAGLFAKVIVFRAAVGGSVVWLAAVMAVNTVIALYYYLRFAAVLYADAEQPVPAPLLAVDSAPVAVPWPVGAAIAVSGLAAVAFSVDPQLVFRLAPLATFAGG